MIYESLFEQTGNKQIKAGLIGTGTYGISLLAQTQRISRLNIPVICDQDLQCVFYLFYVSLSDVSLRGDDMCMMYFVFSRHVFLPRSCRVLNKAVLRDLATCSHPASRHTY